MKNQNHKRWVTSVISVAVIALIIFIINNTGLRKSEGRIERDIFQHVRLGDDFADVKNFIQRSGYEIIIENKTSGRTNRRDVRIGQMHFLAQMGAYGMFFKTNVFAVFAFDGDGGLVDIWVIKEWDAL